MSRFVIGVQSPRYYPPNSLPEFLLIGASNAGKSTLVNAISRSRIARISRTPGKTRTVNFYDLGPYWLVDMPGYGYARAGGQVRDNLLRMIGDYLNHRENTYGACQVCSKGELTAQDLEIQSYLCGRFDNYLLLLNKVDRLNTRDRTLLLRRVLEQTSLPESKVMMISGRDAINVDQLRGRLNSWARP